MADEVSILQNLVSIPSENPGGNELKIIAFCEDLLGSHGIHCERIALDAERPNLIASIGSGNPTLILQSHLDTKPAAHAGTSLEQWKYPPFEPTRVGDILYGLGACDTKGGAAAQIAALIEVAAEIKDLAGTLIWQGVADEEHGSKYGTEFLLSKGMLLAAAAVVAEPTRGLPSFAQMGNCWVEVEIKGTAAHGGTPWVGEDAISRLLELVQHVSALVDQHRNGDERFGGHPFLRVGSISGGSHAGTVASTASVVTDIRVPPGEKRELYLNLWKSAVATFSSKYPSSVVILKEFAGGGCEPHEVHSLSSIAIASSEATKDALDSQNFAPSFFYGGTDARYFAKAGTPTIVLGPGDLEQAHIPNEYVDLQQVKQVKRILKGIIQRTLSPG